MAGSKLVERKAHSIPDAAAIMSISRSGVYRLLAENRLQSVRIRGRRLVLATSIDSLLAQCATQ